MANNQLNYVCGYGTLATLNILIGHEPLSKASNNGYQYLMGLRELNIPRHTFNLWNQEIHVGY